MIEVVTVELAWKMKWDYLIITNLLGLCFNLFVVFASYSWYKHHFGAIRTCCTHYTAWYICSCSTLFTKKLFSHSMSLRIVLEFTIFLIQLKLFYTVIKRQMAWINKFLLFALNIYSYKYKANSFQYSYCKL